MRPVEALRMQERLTKEMGKPRWQEFAEFYTQQATTHWDEEHRILNHATTYYVANQMNPLLEMGFRDLDDQIAIEYYHIPSPVGFCVFDEPLNVGHRTLWDHADDETPTVHGIRAFSWVTTNTVNEWEEGNTNYPMTGSIVSTGEAGTTAVLCTGYIDTLPEERSYMGDLTPIFTAGLFMGTGLAGLRDYLMKKWGSRANQEDYVPPTTLSAASEFFRTEKPRFPSQDKAALLFAEIDETLNHCKLMMDVWFMMSQKVVEVVPQSTLLPGQLPPLVKKGKRKVRARVPEVSVINLRRKQLVSDDEAGRDQEHQAREWKHQWVVKGHWRSQPYGEGRKLRRPVYIHPHIKGPVDAPLLDNKKVYRLSQ